MRAFDGNLGPYLTKIQQAADAAIIRVDCFELSGGNLTSAYRYNNSDVDVPFYDYAADVGSGELGVGALGSTHLAGAGSGPIAIYRANTLRVEGLKSSSKIGLEVDEQEIVFKYLPAVQYAQVADAAHSGMLGTGHLGSLTLATGSAAGPLFGNVEAIEGVPFAEALRSHLLDYATIKVTRAFLPDWGPAGSMLASAPIGTTLRFQGQVADITEIGDTTAKLKVKSDLVLLDQDMPRNVFDPLCHYTLFDAGCTLVRTAHRHSGTVGSGSTQRVINWANPLVPPQPNLGTIQFTSGALNGLIWQVAFSDSTSSTLDADMPIAPTVGDTFFIWPGCDHTDGALGCGYFSNQAHFSGFPRVPPPTTAY